jgi:Na+-driven multidrug efflux pump
MAALKGSYNLWLKVNKEAIESQESDNDWEKLDEANKKEYKALSEYKPIWSLLYLSIGPFISQLSLSFSGIINSIYVAKTIGDLGVEVFSLMGFFDYFISAIKQYCQASVSLRTSYLLGKDEIRECAQVYADLVRVSLLLGILFPMFFLSITKPVSLWYGAGTELSNMTFEYMLPLQILSFMTYFYQSAAGLLQGEGESLIFALCRVAVLALQLAVFEPMFLYGIKSSIWEASLSVVLAQGFVALFMNIYFFRGKLLTTISWEGGFQQIFTRNEVCNQARNSSFC